MNTHAIKCPNCGGELQIPDDPDGLDIVSCMFCGGKVALQKPARPKTDHSNLLHLARTAEAARNYAEAEIYYTRVLEYDITNPDVWIGKGVAAGWQASLANPRLEEVAACFQNAGRYQLNAAQIGKMSDATVNIAIALQQSAMEVFKVEKPASDLASLNDIDLTGKSKVDSALENHFVQSATVIAFLEKVFDLFVAIREKSRNQRKNAAESDKAVCPFCNQHYEYDAQLDGQETECQVCGNTFILVRAENDMPDNELETACGNAIASVGDIINVFAAGVVKLNKEHNFGSPDPAVRQFCESKINKVTPVIKAIKPDYDNGYRPPSLSDKAAGCMKFIWGIICFIILLALLIVFLVI